MSEGVKSVKFMNFVLASLVFFILGVHMNASAAVKSSVEKKILPALDLNPAQINFDYMSSEGDIWYDCITKKLDQPHQFLADCGNGHAVFQIHLMLNVHPKKVSAPGVAPEVSETTYELHYWATRQTDSFHKESQTRTQSTWLTVDTLANTKRIVSYVGFDEDAFQLRIEVNL